MDDSEQPGRRFGSAARTYHEAGPHTPIDAFAWLTDHPGPQPFLEALDLGAGTGRFTGQLLKWIPTVHAIEPDMRMLTILRRTCPTAVASLGSAESLPLPSGSVDAVFAADSWHWLDHPAATAEIIRVLRPSGRLAVSWNLPDSSVPWVDELEQLVELRHDPGHEPGGFALPEAAPFTEPEHQVFLWQWAVTPTDLVLSLGTDDNILALPAADRDAVLEKAAQYLGDHPELLDPDEYIPVPIRTVCYRTQLRTS